MWLVDAETKTLVSIIAEWQVYQSYAIVSHTWGEEELTFQDLRSGDFRAKKGYVKLQNACQQAISDGLKYVWLDTCCIDKSSSAELSEAINSMFRWYNKAARCYAFLSDVSPRPYVLRDPTKALSPWAVQTHDVSIVVTNVDEECEPRPTGTEQVSDRTSSPIAGTIGVTAQVPRLADTSNVSQRLQRDRHNEFSASKWFTRGWTLQELIAPEEVYFYDFQWHLIGTKAALLLSLNAITSVEPLALQGAENMTSFTIAQRMSWASQRATSRPEDQAYSLLGIFDVNMPLLYCEGGEKAFYRLQQEILARSTDHSLFAWDHIQSLRGQAQLLAPSPSNFEEAGKIISYHHQFQDGGSYELTNIGLRIKLRVLKVNEHVALGILNCRFSDDFRGPIALRLASRGESLIELDRRQVYQVSPRRQNGSDEADLEGFPSICGSRVSTVPMSKVKLAKWSDILIVMMGTRLVHLHTLIALRKRLALSSRVTKSLVRDGA